MAKEKIDNFEKALDENERVELFLSRHWKKMLAAILVLLIAFITGYLIYSGKQKDIAQATLALANAKVGEIPALLVKHPDVPGAAFARLRLAHHLVTEKKYEEAAANFLTFAQDSTVPVELAFRARFSAAACKEDLGKDQEALTIYLAIFNDQAATPSTRAEAAFQSGRIYLARNDKNNAAATLKVIVDDPRMASDRWGILCRNMYDNCK